MIGPLPSFDVALVLRVGGDVLYSHGDLDRVFPRSVYEFKRAFEGVTSATDAWLAVGASSLSAIVGFIFLAWLARLRPSALAWIAAFAWGTGGALIISGFGCVAWRSMSAMVLR